MEDDDHCVQQAQIPSHLQNSKQSLHFCYAGEQHYHLYSQIRHQFDGDLKNHLQSILDQGQIGDWFVLYQLSKNSNYYFYREFIRELAKDLKQKPKQSLSGSSGVRNPNSL